MKIIFKNEAHKDFFQKAEGFCKEWDNSHKALFYVLGICPDCRKHISDIFDFEKDSYGIKIDTVFGQGWQTSGSLNCIRMGYNLFNGYTDGYTSPYDLFICEYAPYFLEAVKVFYPNGFTQDLYQIENENGRIIVEDVPLFLADDYLENCEKEYNCKCAINPKTEISMDV